MTVLHQTNNINKEIEIILKEIKEPSGNSGVKKYNNWNFKNSLEDFPGGTVVKNLPANAGDTGLSPGPGRSHMTQSN